MKRVKQLPDDTQIYPGHDYVEKNQQFSLGIEWENPAYLKLLKEIQLRKEDALKAIYLVPSSVAQEKQSNIFFRTDNKQIKEKMKCEVEEDCMSELRRHKDNNVSLKSSL